jgi:hypothetical protein
MNRKIPFDLLKRDYILLTSHHIIIRSLECKYENDDDVID